MSHRTRPAAVLLFLLASVRFGVPSPARAQGVPSASGWEAGLETRQIFYDSDLPGWSPWRVHTLHTARRLPRGLVRGVLFQQARFGEQETGIGVQVYHDLGEDAYGTVRLSAAPQERVLPGVDASAAYYQGIGPWVIDLGARLMDYDPDPVPVLTAGAARYAGPWYVRLRVYAAPLRGRTGSSVALALRRYLGADDRYLELDAATGMEAATVGGTASGPIVELRDTTRLELRLEHRLTDTLGIRLGMMFTACEGLPDGTGLKAGLTLYP